MKHCVLLMEPTIKPVGVEYLKENSNVVIAPNGKEKTIIEYVNKYNVEGIVVRMESITRRIVESCPSLKAVGQYGVGLDLFDIPACTEHGIRVLNVPDANAVAVAEHAMTFILALSKKLVMATKAMNEGDWAFRERNSVYEVCDKTLYVMGFGRIGRNIAKKAQAFDMKVIAYDPYVTKEQMAELGVEKMETIKEGLPLADYVTLHMALTPETRGMMGEAQFKAMKDSAYLLNLSRGPVVDYDALTVALKGGVIAGAALDVFDPEPPKADAEILKLPNVIMTPHLAGNSYEALNRLASTISRTILEALDGKETYNWVNRKAMEEAGTV